MLLGELKDYFLDMGCNAEFCDPGVLSISKDGKTVKVWEHEADEQSSYIYVNDDKGEPWMLSNSHHACARIEIELGLRNSEEYFANMAFNGGKDEKNI